MSAETPQPKHGDIVLQCAHARTSPRWHWFSVEPGISFTRPDRTTGLSRWIVACPSCAVAADFDCLKIRVAGDATWKGDEPFLPLQNVKESRS